MRIDTLRKFALGVASEISDGHFTIMKFTTNWRAAFFTPESRQDIVKMSIGKTEKEAINNALQQKLLG